MSDRRKSETLLAGRSASGRAESAESLAGDPALRRLQASVGNEGLRALMNQGRADRGTMLAHVVDRLSVMQQLQLRENSLLDRGAGFEWQRQLARDDKKITLPDPNRWHAPTEAYKKAVKALCQGDITRGVQLLESAMALEQKTMDQMSSLVDLVDLESDARPDNNVLDGLMQVGQLEPIAPPPGIEIADAILSKEVPLPHVPEVRRPGPWWARHLDEEEEEEEGDGEGGGDAAG